MADEAGGVIRPGVAEEVRAGRVAVLGGTGLIGRHVVSALLHANVRNTIATHRARAPFAANDVEWRQANLLNLEDARSAIVGADTVVHCAGRLSTASTLRQDPVSSVLDTLRIGTNVLQAASEARVARLVMISSCTGYAEGTSEKQEGAMFANDPPSDWFGVGWMHRYLEKQLQWYCTHLRTIRSAIVLRPTLVYGPHDDFRVETAHFVPSFVRRVVERERPIEVWGDGMQTRNLLHAADAASAIVAALGNDVGYNAYNVASAGSTSVNDVLSVLLDIDGFGDADVVHRHDRSGNVAAVNVSGAAFSLRFSWLPRVSLREGLSETVAWYREHRKR